MANILVIKSSATGEASVTNQLVDELVAALPGAAVVERDLGTAPLPHLTPGRLAGLGRIPPEGQSETEAHDARGLSDTVIAEAKAAEIIVIGAPMYNFGIPTALKGWFDYLARAGETFSYASGKPEGLLTGKRVIVVEARAGLYSEGPGAAQDQQEPYLKTVLAFLGLTDIEFIRAEKLAYGPEARAASLESARAAIRTASAA